MWTKAQLAEDLRNIGLYEGASVLVHSSLRAVGPIEGGVATLVRAFQEALGPEGTLIVPTFTFDHTDPVGWREPPSSPEALERLRAEIEVFNPETTPTTVRWIGVFPEVVRQWHGAKRSNHPV